MHQVWTWLSGKKSAIAATAGVLLAWAQAYGWIDTNTSIMLASILSVWTGLAVGDKVVKAYSGDATK